MGYAFVCAVLIGIQFFSLLLSGKTNRERYQARAILIPWIIMALVGYLSNLILPLLGFFDLPSLAVVFTPFATVGILYAMVKYQFMQVSPEIAADEILSRTLDLILLTDLQFHMIKANKRVEVILGFDEFELIDQPIHSLIYEQDTFDDTITEVKQTRQSQTVQLTYRTKQNQPIPIKLVISPMLDRWNDPIGYCFVGYDLRSMNELEQEIQHRQELSEKLHQTNHQLQFALNAAQEANQVKNRFLANVSHELRTPLNSILVSNSMLQSGASTNKINEYTDMIHRSTNTLQQLVDHLLDLAQMDAGDSNLETTRFHVDSLFKEVTEAIQNRITSDNAANLNIRYTLDSSVPTYLIGDALRLRQILNHLLDNAYKFTTHGSIHTFVQLHRTDGDKVILRIQVEDTGIGIDPKQSALIFEGFHQVESQSTRTYAGAGLGLTLTKRLVEQMNGSIWVKSELGKGCTFYFTVSLQKTHEHALGASTSKDCTSLETTGESEKPIRILIVDDYEDNQLLFQDVLEFENFQCDVANNGKEAIEAWERGSFDLILMDIQMPVMDGYDATRYIRSHEPDGTHIPIIAVTAGALKGDEAKSLEVWMDSYITKPVSPVTLIQAVYQALGIGDNGV